MLEAPQLDAQALAKLKLNIQPFLPPQQFEDYFVNTSLGMLINGVFQQLANHNGVQVIKGEFGCGKTSFCHRLLCEVPDKFSIDLHPASAGHTINTLLHTLAGLGEPKTKIGTQELAVQAANRIFRQLHGQQQSVLLIDDAHVLTPKTLQTLFKFLSAVAKQDYGRLKLILVGERKIDETLAKIDTSLLNPDDIFSTLLRPLNRQDIEHYIRFRLERANANQSLPLTKKELADIQSRCGGLPYKINKLTCETLNRHNGNFPAGKPSRKLFLSFAALLIALVPLLYWLIGSKPPATALTRSGADHEVVKNDASGAETTDKSPTIATATANDPVKEPATNPESMALAVHQNSGAAGSFSDNRELAGKSEESAKLNEPEPAAHTPDQEFETLFRQPAGKIIEHTSSASWLSLQPETRYMIQLAGTWNLESLLDLSRRLQLSKTLVFHRSLRNNQDWYILLYGPFEDDSAAQDGISELPLEIRSNNPWIRPVASLKKTP